MTWGSGSGSGFSSASSTRFSFLCFTPFFPQQKTFFFVKISFAPNVCAGRYLLYNSIRSIFVGVSLQCLRKAIATHILYSYSGRSQTSTMLCTFFLLYHCQYPNIIVSSAAWLKVRSLVHRIALTVFSIFLIRFSASLCSLAVCLCRCLSRSRLASIRLSSLSLFILAAFVYSTVYMVK